MHSTNRSYQNLLVIFIVLTVGILMVQPSENIIPRNNNKSSINIFGRNLIINNKSKSQSSPYGCPNAGCDGGWNGQNSTLP